METQLKQILFIDDEPTFGKTAKLCLEKFQLYAVDVSLNAADGLRKIEQGRYDVVFLDVLMPQMEGQDALEKIKQICGTPVVILSAYVSPLLEAEILQRGAFACLRKPAEIDQLILLIHKAIESGTH